jgi:choline dehydrogenase-like flavoprotein
LRGQASISWKNDDEFRTSYYQLSPPTRFGGKYRTLIKTSQRINVLLNATVTAVRLAPNGSTCIGLGVVAPDGRRVTVSARKYVLACGAIENARLLLISDDIVSLGLGNEHDQVGRFFMDHPAFTSGAMVPADPKLELGLYVYDSHPKFRGFGTVAPTPALMERLRTVNFNVELQPTYLGTGDSLNQLKKNYWDLAHNLRRGRVIEDFGHNIGMFFSMIGNGASYAMSSVLNRDQQLAKVDLRHHLECSPNPQSRVTVNRQRRDRLGLPVAQLDWQIKHSDIDGWLRGQEAMALAVGKAGIGRVRIDYQPSRGVKSLNIESAWHHMGTTRMHPDARRGVVDQSCRVHGVDNLFVAGSSVFPTSGDANPTLTIVALALRLGDQLKGKA